MSDDTSWYSARILYESLHPQEPDEPRFFEEIVVLIRAMNDEDATRKATSHAKSKEYQYDNTYGNRVEVVFREVLDVREVLGDKVDEFSEVYYHFLNAEEVEQIKRSLEPSSADERWPEPSKTSR